MEIIKLNPVFKDYLWGGDRLKTQYQKQSDLEIVAESWEVSTHKDGNSVVEATKQPLSVFLQQHPDFLGKKYADLPILIKFIDAKQSLSIQVHPDEAYANQYENDHGKTEMWYIMDCDSDSFIYYGVNRPMDQQSFKEAIYNNTILDCLNQVKVKKGDYFLIEAGTLHAIGPGLLICEIQQNSNATYRVFDYNRRDKNGNLRQLHIDKAVDVTNLNPIAKGQSGNVNHQDQMMVNCPLFCCQYQVCHQEKRLQLDKENFKAIIFLSGEGTMSHQDQSLTYRKGDSFLLSAKVSELTVSQDSEFILVTV